MIWHSPLEVNISYLEPLYKIFAVTVCKLVQLLQLCPTQLDTLIAKMDEILEKRFMLNCYIKNLYNYNSLIFCTVWNLTTEYFFLMFKNSLYYSEVIKFLCFHIKCLHRVTSKLCNALHNLVFSDMSHTILFQYLYNI